MNSTLHRQLVDRLTKEYPMAYEVLIRLLDKVDYETLLEVDSIMLELNV